MATAVELDCRDVYEPVYAKMAVSDDRTSEWRALVSRTNAEATEQLLAAADLRPARILDIGCGDGALLGELARPGERSFHAVEIVESAVALARRRAIPGVESVDLFDGVHIGEPAAAFDLALLIFVLEHSEEPLALLREACRVADHVALAVVLDDTLAARRPSHRREAARVGHRQRFTRWSLRGLLAEAGLEVVEERVEMPPLEVFTFWAEDTPREGRARTLGRARRGLHRVLPRTTERLVAANYRCVARRAA
jgi:SAM-dependent methyltransferase